MTNQKTRTEYHFGVDRGSADHDSYVLVSSNVGKRNFRVIANQFKPFGTHVMDNGVARCLVKQNGKICGKTRNTFYSIQRHIAKVHGGTTR